MNVQSVKKIEDFKYIAVPGKVFREIAVPTNFNHTANYYRNLARATVDKMHFWAKNSKSKKKSEGLLRDARIVWRRAVWVTNQLNAREVVRL